MHRAWSTVGLPIDQARLCGREELEAHVEASKGIQSPPAAFSTIAYAAPLFRAMHHSVHWATMLTGLHCCPVYRSLLPEVLGYFAQGKNSSSKKSRGLDVSP